MSMDSFTDENWLVFTKTDKTERFTENRPVEFEIFKKLRNFGIKILKKTGHHFKNFGQNKIQKFIIFHPGKSRKVRPLLK
jgi:hypothetical protein